MQEFAPAPLLHEVPPPHVVPDMQASPAVVLSPSEHGIALQAALESQLGPGVGWQAVPAHAVEPLAHTSSNVAALPSSHVIAGEAPAHPATALHDVAPVPVLQVTAPAAPLSILQVPVVPSLAQDEPTVAPFVSSHALLLHSALALQVWPPRPSTGLPTVVQGVPAQLPDVHLSSKVPALLSSHGALAQAVLALQVPPALGWQAVPAVPDSTPQVV